MHRSNRRYDDGFVIAVVGIVRLSPRMDVAQGAHLLNRKGGLGVNVDEHHVGIVPLVSSSMTARKGRVGRNRSLCRRTRCRYRPEQLA